MGRSLSLLITDWQNINVVVVLLCSIVVVVNVYSHIIQRIALATEETTVTQQFSHRSNVCSMYCVWPHI